MPISMYQASVPVFTRMLGNLSAILDKAAAHCAVKQIDPAALMQYRLYPDMLPFLRQITIACDTAKGAAARLAGVEIPRHEDGEKTFDELKARIAKTVEFLGTVTAAQVDGSEERPITLKLRAGDVNFRGLQYLIGFALPNFYFHATTAYDILRHNGVELGKADFLGPR
jgi:hypothetical protein